MSDTSDALPPPTSLAELRSRRKPPKNTYQEVQENLSLLNRVAVWVTERVGTMGFFMLIMVWTIFWLGWNTLLPNGMRFDPAMGFVLYLFICNVIQILLMPLIMVGQNLQGMHSEARAQHDLDVNVKSEEEIEVILQHLEYQNQLLMKMVDKLGVDLRQGLAKS